MIIIGPKCFLSQVGQKLAESGQGVELLKHIRTSLSESASEYFKQTIKEVIDVAIVGTRNGEKEGWVTAHGSSVRVITPYDNIITIMHEGGPVVEARAR